MRHNQWWPKKTTSNYRSGLEEQIARQLTYSKIKFEYETKVIKYIKPEKSHRYTPDFVFTKKNGEFMFIETKGRWTTADRTKMKHVLASNPDLDIRMVFQNPTQKISKASKTTYESYALKLGIKHVAKKSIPTEWLEECLQNGEEPVTIKSFFA